MKGDFSRQTFARKNHYSGVRMQQGRVQLDADWNEQADINAHRARTTTRDLVGLCGGPLGGAAFAVTAVPRTDTPGAEFEPANGFELVRGVRARGVADGTPIIRRVPVNAGDDFKLGAGRYYVHGILCENEAEVLYSDQPDFPEATKLGTAPFAADGGYLLYLDVWQRHLTALDDPHIRETALGGPDTATRTKTVWQAKLWPVPPGNGVNCPAVFQRFLTDEVIRNKGMLNASTAPEQADADPCIVSPTAGFRGLENLLYRVEMHAGGTATDVSAAAGSVAVQSFGSTAHNQLTVAAGLAVNVGDAVELYPTRAGSDPMSGRLYFVTNVSGQTLTLGQDIQGIDMAEQPRLRPAQVTFKWSRQNGSVVTKIETFSTRDSKEVTVQSLGPDDELGFSDGDLVELTDDLTELRGLPGQLTQIVTADNATRTVVLKDAPAVRASRNPKMRRWDGLAPVRTNPDAAHNWITIENGLRIQFPSTGTADSPGNPPKYKTGDYWLIPTRTATADRQSGQIEWPADEETGDPQAQPPEGIEHSYCPLALLHWTRAAGIAAPVKDCRRLFPPVTELTTLHYVSGTGQEVRPDSPVAPGSLVELRHPLVVGVSNGAIPVEGARVVFEIYEGEMNPAQPATDGSFPNGRLSAVPGDPPSVPAAGTRIEVRTNADGLARCKWELSQNRWNQQVVARLLGQNDQPVHLPVRFDANLSIASEVAYEPAQKCQHLKGMKTVQEALDELCNLIGLIDEPGIHVTDVIPGDASMLKERPGGPIPADIRPDVLPKPAAHIVNDIDLPCEALAQGLLIMCDQEVYPGSVKGRPTCFVTLELPFPYDAAEKKSWGGATNARGFIGYRPVVLDSDADIVASNGKIINWRPSEAAALWLRETLTGLLDSLEKNNPGSKRSGRILARLTLKGNFIWARNDDRLYLDGDLFGVAAKEGTVTAARTPSGDGKRGGDLELWFWLIQFRVTLDKSDLEVNEKTTGHVILSAPAPAGGANVALSILDASFAKLGRRGIVIAEGQTQGAFELTGVKPGSTEVVASYAGGVRRVAVNVIVPQPPAPPPRVEAVSIGRSDPTRGDEQLAFVSNQTTLPTPLVLTVSQGQSPNAIQVDFTADVPVRLAAVTVKNFVVQLGDQQVAGAVTVVAGANAVLWKANEMLKPGEYSVTLLGDGAGAIVSDKGKRLDGEPTKLPSGDGKEGGNFNFILKVQEVQPQPLAQRELLKVKRISLINNVMFIPEAHIWERDERQDYTTELVLLDPGQELNVIEVEFKGGPVNQDSVRNDVNFCVWNMLPNSVVKLQSGALTWVSDAVVRWTMLPVGEGPRKLKVLPKGDYTFALVAGPSPVVNVPGATPVTAKDGSFLDGEPQPLMPSGDGQPGGTFFLKFRVR